MVSNCPVLIASYLEQTETQCVLSERESAIIAMIMASRWKSVNLTQLTRLQVCVDCCHREQVSTRQSPDIRRKDDSIAGD
jgi:hypothetical protein